MPPTRGTHTSRCRAISTSRRGSTPPESSSGVFPTLVFVQGNEQRIINLDHSPFSVGRKVDKDLVIADPRVSRDHALIVLEEEGFFLVDQGSKHGTFVNGERIGGPDHGSGRGQSHVAQAHRSR